MTELVSITVSIPANTVQDLYGYVAGLHAPAEPVAATTETLGDKTEPKKRAQAGFGVNTVRKHYKGGVSDYWRPFLEELADHPGEWCEWEALCEAVGLTPRQASGMLGAAERRCKLLPPYEKAYEDGQYWFRMPQTVADIIKELASA